LCASVAGVWDPALRSTEMGIFCRKPFRAGPLRMNLSKFGHRYLWLATKALESALDRAALLFLGGRDGIYFRKSVGSSRKGEGAGATTNNLMVIFFGVLLLIFGSVVVAIVGFVLWVMLRG